MKIESIEKTFDFDNLLQIDLMTSILNKFLVIITFNVLKKINYIKHDHSNTTQVKISFQTIKKGFVRISFMKSLRFTLINIFL